MQQSVASPVVDRVVAYDKISSSVGAHLVSWFNVLQCKNIHMLSVQEISILWNYKSDSNSMLFWFLGSISKWSFGKSYINIGSIMIT
jgi:hypothetical protein